MAIKEILRINRKTFIDIPSWLGMPVLRAHFKTTWVLARGLYKPSSTVRKETFNEAVGRLQVTETDLHNIIENYRFNVGLFAFMSLFTASLAGYFLLTGYLAPVLLSMAVAILFLSQAFKYHFWLFQIKKRKLGCTLQEWWAGQFKQ